jgi:curved DNA-binding protein CbpA
MDFYEVLGVSFAATQDEIKSAYRRLAFEFHPDRQSGSEEEFKKVAEAYATLSDGPKRRNYDLLRHHRAPEAAPKPKPQAKERKQPKQPRAYQRDPVLHVDPEHVDLWAQMRVYDEEEREREEKGLATKGARYGRLLYPAPWES